MTREYAEYYISILMERFDADAYHSLIEGGVECEAAVIIALNRCNEEQFVRMVEVLKEFRGQTTREALKRLCMAPYSKRWVAAAEALFHVDPKWAVSVLEEQLGDLGAQEKELKSELTNELIDLARSPIYADLCGGRGGADPGLQG